MSVMLPVPEARTPRLADVLVSCVASIVGAKSGWPDPKIKLPVVRKAVVVVVDGLGAHNLRARSGHARFLASRMARNDVIQTVVPTTTAAALTSLTTGVMPGEHGIVGYRVLEPSLDRLVKQLSGWDQGLLPAGWQRAETVFSRAARIGLPSFVIGAPRYAESGFTKNVLPGATYISATSIVERFESVLEVFSRPGDVLCYLYIPELDQIAHSAGWQNERWSAELEIVDAAISGFIRNLPVNIGVLVTADHGVIDVPSNRHVFIDRDPEMVAGIRHVGGEPRFLSLYFDHNISIAERERLFIRWQHAESKRAWVMRRDQAISAKLYGEVNPEIADRIGDILVAARSGIAYYDAREAVRTPERMIGQHGSLTDEETRIPFIRLGAYASWS